MSCVLVCLKFQVPEPVALSWRRPHRHRCSQAQELQTQLAEATRRLNGPMAVDLLDEMTIEWPKYDPSEAMTSMTLWLSQARAKGDEFRKGTQFAALVHGRLALASPTECCTILGLTTIIFLRRNLADIETCWNTSFNCHHFPNMSKGYARPEVRNPNASLKRTQHLSANRRPRNRTPFAHQERHRHQGSALSFLLVFFFKWASSKTSLYVSWRSCVIRGLRKQNPEPRKLA